MFDVQKFRDAKIVQRTREVTVEQFAPFFEEGEKPIVKIRNITGHELAVCNEAVDSNKQIRATIEKLMSSSAKEKAEAICESLGVSGKTPDDLVRRINLLRFGAVDPQLTNEDAVRIASMFPVAFYDLTNQIITLTGLGAELGE